MSKFFTRGNIIAITSAIILLIIGLVVGLVLLFINENYVFIGEYMISWFFLCTTLVSMRLFTNGYDSKKKNLIIISSVGRFLSMILSIVVSFVFLYFTGNGNSPEIYYIFISPSLILISYVISFFCKD